MGRYRKVTCECGTVYVTGAPCSYRCPKCAKMYKSRYATYYNRYMNADEARRCAEADWRAYIRGEKLPAGPKAQKPHPCPYCGKILKSPRVYCRKCVEQGFDSLHQVTGKTNGWDGPKKSRGPVKVQGGWRGRAVAGPGYRILQGKDY